MLEAVSNTYGNKSILAVDDIQLISGTCEGKLLVYHYYSFLYSKLLAH